MSLLRHLRRALYAAPPPASACLLAFGFGLVCAFALAAAPTAP